MPISAGEVNAALRFTIVSQDIGATQAKLRDLAEQFRAAGGAATQSGTAIAQSMLFPQRELLTLKTEAVELKAALAEFEAERGLTSLTRKAQEAGQSMNQLEGITIRMIERMAILFAVREAFGFVKGLFDAADATAALSDRLGNSIKYLQQLEQVGEGVGAKFTETSRALIHMNDELSKFQGGDILKELGLNFDELFHLNPDERFNKIALSIAQLPSPLERSRAELQLFGTDAIDPLIMKLAQLGDNLDKVTDPIDEHTVRSFAAAKRAYDDFGETLKVVGAHILDFGSSITQASASPFFIYATSGFQGLRDAAVNGIMFGNSLEDIGKAAEHVKNVGPIPLLGQAFIDNLRTSIPLTKEQRNALDQLREMDELTFKNAVRATGQNQISEAQYKAYTASVREDTAAQREHEAQVKKLATEYKHAQEVIDEVFSAGEGWKGTLAGLNKDLVEHIKLMLQAGVSQKTVAEWYGVTAAQVHAVTKEIQAEEAATKLAMKTQEDLTKVMARVSEIRQDDEASDLERHLNANKRKYEDDVANARKRGVVDEEYYAALDLLRRTDSAAAEKRLSDNTRFSRVHYLEEYKNANDLYQSILQNASDHTQAEVEDAKAKMEAKKLAYDNWKDTAIADMQAVSAQAAQTAAIVNTIRPRWTDQKGNAISAPTITQDIVGHTHAVSEGEARNTKALGAEILRLTQSIETWRLPPLDFHGVIDSGGGGYEQYYRALQMQIASAQHHADDIAQLGYLTKLQSLLSSIPGAATGGVVKVGERGAELVKLPDGAAVFPNGSVPATGRENGIVIHFHVNGTGAQVYEDFRRRMMQDIRTSRLVSAS